MDIKKLVSSDNIAKHLDEETLLKIGKDAYEGFMSDLNSRKDWEEDLENWTKLALQISENKTFPWTGASNVKYPLLSTAAMQFNARAYPSLVPSDGKLVKFKIRGFDADGQKAEKAHRVSTHMSYQILEEMDKWEEEIRHETWDLELSRCLRPESRHRDEHTQTLSLSDIPRFAELGVIASMQPTHCISDKKFYEKRIGTERSKGAYAWRSLLDAGAMLAFGTDYQVEPLNPMEGLYAAVSRKERLGEDGDGWFPGQKLVMEEAIKYYTWGAAYAQFMEDRKGIIKTGYLADIVITDKDLLTIPETEIMKTKIDYTITGGRVVYESGK